MSLKFFFIFLTTVSFCFAKTKTTKKTARQPTQEQLENQNALLTPHNCRIVIDLTLVDKSHQVLVLPYMLASEAQCLIAKKNHEASQDPSVIKKSVTHIWLDN